MNMRSMLVSAAIASTITVGLPAINWAQFNSGKTYEPTEAQLAEKMARDAAKQAAVAERAAFDAKKEVEFKFKHLFPGGPGFSPPGDKIREAAAQVRDAKDEAARAAAMTQLNSQLDQYFEEDMKARNKELEGIESRLEKLRAQLDRRRQKKSEIIDLQAKVAINEAEGLGFYGQPKADMTFNVLAAPVPVTSSDDLVQPPPPNPFWNPPAASR